MLVNIKFSSVVQKTSASQEHCSFIISLSSCIQAKEAQYSKTSSKLLSSLTLKSGRRRKDCKQPNKLKNHLQPLLYPALYASVLGTCTWPAKFLCQTCSYLIISDSSAFLWHFWLVFPLPQLLLQPQTTMIWNNCCWCFSTIDPGHGLSMLTSL